MKTLHVNSETGCHCSYHMGILIDGAVAALLAVFTATFGKVPRFKVHGGDVRENLALQNIQVSGFYLVILYLVINSLFLCYT